MAELRVAVVIPAFQAERTIRDVVARTRAAVPTAQIIIVDDGSTDDTARAAADFVIGHDANLGKGAALRDGIDEAMRHGATAIVTVDADGQHPPEQIPSLLAPIASGQADIVLGSRERCPAMPVGRRVTNWLSARLACRIAGQPVGDP